MSTNAAGVGIIIPPPEIRKLADTTAQYVVNIGPSFEQMVIEKEQNNPQFCFMKLEDPYRAYFDHKIQEFTAVKQDEQKQKEQSQQNQGIITSLVTDQNKQLEQQLQQSEIEKQKQLQEQEQKKKTLKAPDPDQYTVSQPKGLTQLEVDIMKHSAQFVATNGKKFLVALTERERQNPQFEFLKPSSDLFTYFMALIEAYTKCRNIKKSDLDTIVKNYEDKMSILRKCGEIYEYENFKRQETRKMIEEGEEEKQKLAQVDWNDFIVVETIDFVDEEFQPLETQDIDDIYQPQTTQEVYEAKASKEQERLEQQKREEQRRKEEERERKLKQQIEEETKGLQEKQKQIQQEIEQQKEREEQQKIVTETFVPDDNIELRADYVPKTDQNTQQYSLCQNCGKMIPTKDMNEHIRIELMNPEAYQQKITSSKASNSSAINDGGDIAANLQSIKRKRPDIFREQGEDLVQQTFEDEEKQQHGDQVQKKIHWDGQDRNMTRTTANIAIMQHQERKKNLDLQKQYGGHIAGGGEQFNQYTQNSTIASNLQGNTNISIQPSNLQSQQQNYNSAAPSLRDQTIRVTKDGMIFEEGVGLKEELEWLKTNNQDVKINIRVPEVEQDDIKFKRQTIQLTIPPTTSILQLKIQLAQQLKNLPAAKQRIRSSLFQNLRDEKTLAYYNIIQNSNLQLELN